MAEEEKRSHPNVMPRVLLWGDFQGTSFEIRCFSEAAALYCTKEEEGVGHRLYACCKNIIHPFHPNLF